MKLRRPTVARTPAARLHSEPLWQRARRLLDQQFWCLGQDVEQIPGNALLLRGLCRVRPASRVYHRSYYSGLVEGSEVVVWSWGLFHRVPGQDAVLLRRARLDPVLVESDEPPREVWCSELVPDRRIAETETDLSRFLNAAAEAFAWLADYETWVGREFGPEHRRASLLQWKRRCADADEMADRWADLAEWCRCRSVEPGKVAC